MLPGRETELALVDEALDRVQHGPCGFLIVNREPGVGKSALGAFRRACRTRC